MKLLILLLLPLIGLSQAAPPKAPKGANTIVVATALSDSALFKQANQLLLDNAYTISRSDKDHVLIETNTKKIEGVTTYLRLVISTTDGKAKITGFFSSTFGLYADPETESIRVTKKGMSSSVYMIAFTIMNDYAVLLAQDTKGVISYEVSP